MRSSMTGSSVWNLHRIPSISMASCIRFVCQIHGKETTVICSFYFCAVPNHGVSWSVATLRRVIAGLSEGMEPHRHDASMAQVLKWLEQAHDSRGGRKPVLAVGRDGLMLPIRGETCYREGATATVSVHDRKGRRLGTVYL